MNPTVRIPKNLIAAVDAAATERGVQPATLVQQVARFYLAATAPSSSPMLSPKR